MENVVHFATSSKFWRYPACGEEGAIFLDMTINPEEVTCIRCKDTPEYNKQIIKQVKENFDEKGS